jgi:hypothetical protein
VGMGFRFLRRAGRVDQICIAEFAGSKLTISVAGAISEVLRLLLTGFIPTL